MRSELRSNIVTESVRERQRIRTDSLRLCCYRQGRVLDRLAGEVRTAHGLNQDRNATRLRMAGIGRVRIFAVGADN